MKKILAIACMSLFLTGCPQLLPALQGAMNVAQWVGSVIEVADHSQKSWFKLNPNDGEQAKVEAAMYRSRKALAALNGIALASKSIDEQNLVAARKELLDAYKELEALFLSMNVPVQPGMKPMKAPRIVESARIEAALVE
jgi:hypothetical protein